MVSDIPAVDLLKEVRSVPKKGGQITAACHHDADGVYSLMLLNEVTKIDYAEFPDEFGEVKDFQQFCLDMRPLSPTWSGICFDHHPLHSLGCKYRLVWDVVPTGLIIWNAFKEVIPPDRWWLVAGSLAGDGQTGIIPPEVFKQTPLLLNGKEKIYEDKYGKGWKVYHYYLYKQLSAPVNAACRIGAALRACQILKEAKGPLDVLENGELSKAKWTGEQEMAKIAKEFSVDEAGHFHVLVFESDFNLQGYVASKLENLGRTALAINRKNGHLSLRGDLATLASLELNKLPWCQISGHAEFMGGKIKMEEMNYPLLLETLRRLP